jgi:hypothetical protein
VTEQHGPDGDQGSGCDLGPPVVPGGSGGEENRDRACRGDQSEQRYERILVGAELVADRDWERDCR